MTNFIIGALLNPSFASTPNSVGPSHSYEHDTISLLGRSLQVDSLGADGDRFYAADER